MIHSISISELLKKTNNISIIDIRSNQSYNNNHIPNAKNVPSQVLISNPNKYLNKEKTYYIYCQKGSSSIRVCSLLNNLGYNTVNINGGYEAWILQK
ncbi:MAG: rhodanese-like domain-containing protein [Firmicutes bacterium]|nr:rhodanese-like domain-containing protein [Bacillota bacterium]